MAQKHDLEKQKYRALDNLASNSIQNFDFNKALENLKERLQLTEEKYREKPDPELEADLAWLHHEIGRSHLARGDLENALKHALQCVKCANLCQDPAWMVQVGTTLSFTRNQS